MAITSAIILKLVVYHPPLTTNMAITSAIHKKYPQLTNNNCGSTISHIYGNNIAKMWFKIHHIYLDNNICQGKITKIGITSAKEQNNYQLYPNKIMRVYQHWYTFCVGNCLEQHFPQTWKKPWQNLAKACLTAKNIVLFQRKYQVYKTQMSLTTV